MSDKSVEGESLGFSLAAQLAWTDVDAPIAELNAPDQPALSPEMATLVSSLDRLEIVIDQETAALEAHQPVDLAEMNRRKSRSLLELSRALRGLPDDVDSSLGERLTGIKAKLTRNCEVLAMHLAAAREITTILNGALRAAESDGTYSTALLGGRTA
ncbi:MULTISPECIES: hypothetical protein [Azorhizobium]|nr:MULTISPECIES: hypothetical protein [Azorhizobium]TDT88870.1 hypothetical protein DFO45_4623 [Azorhizobium sp. AG788]